MSVRALSKAKAMAVNSANVAGNKEKFRAMFVELLDKPLDDQTEFFMKSFIFALGDDWKQVSAFFILSKFTQQSFLFCFFPTVLSLVIVFVCGWSEQREKL